MASPGSDSDSSYGSPRSPASFPTFDSSSSSSSSSSPPSPSATTNMFLPSSEITVASKAEILRELGREGTSTQIKFLLAPDSSLADAHELWGMVTAHGGGEAEFLTPGMLSHKEEAHGFVNNKMERLRRWNRKIDRKQVEVAAKLSKLKKFMDAGGHDLLDGYEPRCYDGVPGFIDITQVVDEDEMDNHIKNIRAFLLDNSPASPGDGVKKEECFDRELKERLDILRLNFEYLELKDTGLKLLSAHLQGGIAALEERFLKNRTHLGAGSAEFGSFVDVPIYQKEVPPEGSPHFYG